MTDAAHCEVKLHAFRRTADGTVVSFLIHPNDTPQCLALDPLGTRYMLAVAQIGDDEQPASSHEAGERPGASSQGGIARQGDLSAGGENPMSGSGGRNHLEAAVVPERAENRDASPAKARYAAMSDMEKARVRACEYCKDRRFQIWLGAPDEKRAAGLLRRYCGIDSRREIATNARAYRFFLEMEEDWRAHAGLETEMRG